MNFSNKLSIFYNSIYFISYKTTPERCGGSLTLLCNANGMVNLRVIKVET